jgi:hypothetical protein
MAQQNFNVSLPNDGLGDELRAAFVKQQTMNTELYDTKVDKVIGKDLSTNDFTDLEQSKLAGIEALAQVNVPINFSDLIGAPTINSIAAFPDTRFDYVDTTSFDLPPNVQAISVRKNGNPTEFVVTNWTQSANVITYGGTMVVGDYLIIGGVYVIGSSLGGTVSSVNGQIGDVVLNADNIAPTATRVYLTPAQLLAIATNTANIALKANKSRTIYQGLTTVTGVTVPTIAFSILIPANTYEAVDGFTLTMTIEKTTTAQSVNYNLYSDTVINGTGQAITTNFSLTTINKSSAMQRILNLSGGNFFTYSSNLNSNTPFNSVNVGNTTRTFNPAVNNFITLEIVGHTVASEISNVTLSIQPLKG